MKTNVITTYQFLGAIFLLLFFLSVIIVSMVIRQKQYRNLVIFVPLICVIYFITQCFFMYLSWKISCERTALIIEAFASIPVVVLAAVSLALAVAEGLMFQDIHRYRSRSITVMSIKEAMDNLPAGICCYKPRGRTLLVNRAMEKFCQQVTGHELTDGNSFSCQLRNGPLEPGCRAVTVGDEYVIVLPDGRAGKIIEREIPFERHKIQMLVAFDITEAYRKTEELRRVRREVEALGERLAAVNREIVDLTSEQEVLNAKVRIHDEMGSNLLAIKRFITSGGTEQEKADLIDSLWMSVSFLKNDRPANTRDEYELMIETASRLGVTVCVDGTLPRTEPNKHIIATAIHECFTNTLRHAHGDKLFVTITEDDRKIAAAFTNNGKQPAGDVVEKGGLVSLRTLVEQAGGVMRICCRPSFAIILELPKEDNYVI